MPDVYCNHTLEDVVKIVLYIYIIYNRIIMDINTEVLNVVRKKVGKSSSSRAS